jgi:Flp pilus assembly protein CpaB
MRMSDPVLMMVLGVLVFTGCSKQSSTAQPTAAPCTTPTSAVHQLSLRFGTSFYGEECKDGQTWRWASAPTEIIIHNDAARPVKGRLSLIAMGVGVPSATIGVTVKGEKPDIEPLTSAGARFEISRTFAPGDTPIGFAPSSRPTKIGTDPRMFDFRVTDVTLTR